MCPWMASSPNPQPTFLRCLAYLCGSAWQRQLRRWPSCHPPASWRLALARRLPERPQAPQGQAGASALGQSPPTHPSHQEVNCPRTCCPRAGCLRAGCLHAGCSVARRRSARSEESSGGTTSAVVSCSAAPPRHLPAAAGSAPESAPGCERPSRRGHGAPSRHGGRCPRDQVASA